MRRGVAAALACVLVVLSGCGTISDLSNEDGGHRIFGGIRKDGQMIGAPDPEAPATTILFGILDLPFSLALDILRFPVTQTLALTEDAPS